MAALEYLTGNALTAHPFKTQKNTSFVPTHPIQGNGDTLSVWFYDILFVSFQSALRRVYISNITKLSSSQVAITFNDCDTGEIISSSEQPALFTLENHYKNSAASFSSWTTNAFAVKIVFGPGLLEKNNFNQTYPKELSELSSAAIVLKSPRVSTLAFNAYNTKKARELNYPADHKFSVVSYNKNTTEPRLKLKHNLFYKAESSSALGLYVSRGAGEGLYNPCTPKGDIEDVYTISLVSPNQNGAILLNTSSCYSANTLTANDEIILGEQVLAPYRAFELVQPSGSVISFNAVSPGSSIFIENFCKPKCAPVQIQAFAHYLNRVTDGAQELDSIAAGNFETHGLCNIQNDLLTAVSFCTDTFFTRCDIPCNSSFLKHFHEGRKIQIAYSATEILTFKILEVISPSIIKLDQSTGYGAEIPFKVLDNGVISNMNCAVTEYNNKAITFLRPYFKVKYTTSESYSPLGVYTTYLSVVVAIYNPSNSPVALRVDFNYAIFKIEGKFKIRKQDGVTVSEIPETYIGCREYVFLEAIFSIGCGITGGFVEVSVFDTTQGVDVQIGQPYALPGINGVPCPSGSPTTEEPPIFKLVSSNLANYSKTITTSNFALSVTFGGNIPSWLNLSFNATTHKITLSLASTPAASVISTLYNMSYTTNYGAVRPFKLLYITTPVITSPIDAVYNNSSPLEINKDVTYTAQSPFLQILANNMQVLSQAFPVDLLLYYYIAHIYGNQSALPAGLIFDKTTGKITGKLSTTVQVGTKIQLYLSARNPAGVATNPQLISLLVTSNTELPYAGALYYYEGATEVDNLSSWASITVWFKDAAHTVRSSLLPSSSNPVILLNNTSANLESWTAPASIDLNGNNLILTAHPYQIDSNQNPLCAAAVVFNTTVTSQNSANLIFSGHINIV